MSDKDIQITGNATDLVQAYKDAIEAGNKFVASLNDASKASTFFNKEGERVSSMLETQTKKGVTIRETWERIDGEMVKSGKTLSYNAKAMEREAKAREAEARREEARRKREVIALEKEKELREAIVRQKKYNQESKQIGDFFSRRMKEETMVARGATFDEKYNLKRAVSSLRDFAKNNEITLKQVQDMWTGLSSGITRSYTGSMATLQDKLIAVMRAEEGIGATIKKTNQVEKDRVSRKLREAKSRQAVAAFFRGEASQAGNMLRGLPSSPVSTNAEKNSLYQQTRMLEKFMIANKITADQVFMVWNDLSNGIVKSYGGKLDDVRNRLVMFSKAHTKMGENAIKIQEANTKALDKQAKAEEKRQKEIEDRRLRAQRIVRGGFESRAFESDVLNPIRANRPSDTNPKRLQILNNEIARLLALQVKLGVSNERMKRMWEQVAAGTATYKGTLAQLQSQMLRTQLAQENLAAKTKGLKQHTQDFVITWRSMIRLLGVQLAHTAISNVMGQMQTGIGDVIEYSKAISRIEAITQSADEGHKRWASTIRDMSDLWGIDILEQVRGTYEAVSNQIVRTTQDIEFMNQSSALAVVTGSKVIDTMNSLSGITNAYGESARDAEKNAALLFKTFDLGRISMQELADLGTIAEPAAMLGIPKGDLMAMLDTLTIIGIKTPEAMTQIRGIFNELLKPNTEMKKLFAELGVPDAETLIQLHGFAGAMALIEEKTKGASTEIAKYFNNIRGGTGAMVFASEKIDIYNRAIAENEKAVEDFIKAQEIMKRDVGKGLEKSFNEMRNFFRMDFVDAAMRKFHDAIGGFDNLTKAGHALTDMLTVMLGPAVAYVTFELGLLAKANPVATGVLIGSAFLGLALHASRTTTLLKTVNAEMRVFRLESAKIATEQSTMMDTSLDAIVNFHKEQNKEYAKGTSDIIKQYAKINDAHEKMYKKVSRRVKDSFDDLGEYSGDIVSKIEDKLNKIGDGIKKFGKKDVSEFLKNQSKYFDIMSKDKDPSTQFRMMSNYGSMLLGYANKAQMKTDVDSYEKYWEQIWSVFDKYTDQIYDINRNSKIFPVGYDRATNQFIMPGGELMTKKQIYEHNMKAPYALHANVEQERFQIQQEFLSLIDKEWKGRQAITAELEKQAKAEKKKLAEAKFFDAELELQMEAYKSFNRKDVFELQDPAEFQKAMLDRQANLWKLGEMQESLGVDYNISDLRTEYYNNEKDLANRYYQLLNEQDAAQRKQDTEAIQERAKRLQELQDLEIQRLQSIKEAVVEMFKLNEDLPPDLLERRKREAGPNAKYTAQMDKFEKALSNNTFGYQDFPEGLARYLTEGERFAANAIKGLKPEEYENFQNLTEEIADSIAKNQQITDDFLTKYVGILEDFQKRRVEGVHPLTSMFDRIPFVGTGELVAGVTKFQQTIDEVIKVFKAPDGSVYNPTSISQGIQTSQQEVDRIKTKLEQEYQVAIDAFKNAPIAAEQTNKMNEALGDLIGALETYTQNALTSAANIKQQEAYLNSILPQSVPYGPPAPGGSNFSTGGTTNNNINIYGTNNPRYDGAKISQMLRNSERNGTAVKSGRRVRVYG